jgi:hypothetical protein
MAGWTVRVAVQHDADAAMLSILGVRVTTSDEFGAQEYRDNPPDVLLMQASSSRSDMHMGCEIVRLSNQQITQVAFWGPRSPVESEDRLETV